MAGVSSVTINGKSYTSGDQVKTDYEAGRITYAQAFWGFDQLYGTNYKASGYYTGIPAGCSGGTAPAITAPTPTPSPTPSPTQTIPGAGSTISVPGYTNVSQSSTGIWWGYNTATGQQDMLYDPNDVYDSVLKSPPTTATTPTPTPTPTGTAVNTMPVTTNETMPTPATGTIPSDYFGETAPYLGWLRQLQAGGLSGNSPYQQWLQSQFARVLSNWWINSLTRTQTGQPSTGWYESPTAWTQDPAAWNRMLSAPTNDQARMQLESTATMPGTGMQGTELGYNAAIQALRAKGVPGLIANAMGTVMPYNEVMSNWGAFANPGAPATTGQSYLDYLNQLFGLAKFG